MGKLKEWDENDNVKKDSVRIMCDESSSEADKEIESKGSRVQAGTSIP